MKKIIAIVLSAVMLSTAGFAEEVTAPRDWAENSIDIANFVGITDKSQKYDYKSNITREEFCELIYNLITLVKGEISVPVTDSFTDTANYKVLTLNSLSIISGKSATEFAPNDYLTREEAATIIVRMVNNVMPMPATEMWFEYEDMEEISEWASHSVQTISNLGFMNGVGNNCFAPKDMYTIEQAITALVRVYDSAEAAKNIVESVGLGIIEGADGPTAIYFAVAKTAEIDNFYIDEALKLVAESAEIAADEKLVSYYASSKKITEQILALGANDFSKPTEIYYMSLDHERINASLKTLLGDEAEDLDIEKLPKWKRSDFVYLANMINASYGAENLAALSVLANSRGYVMPEDFESDFSLFLQYDGEYSAIVSFSEYGEGVISANMSFVKNGDSLYEYIQYFGEDCFEIARVN